MCGVSGLFTRANGSAEAGREMVAEIAASQHSRGPDHRAVEIMPGRRATVILGHNRLSIIDLSSAANQPMWDADRSHSVIFNGEIYNYLEIREELASLGRRFVTQSDTEVLLEAFKEWGTSAFERFNGMFAIALYRASDERLFLARDRFGVKPLYYIHKDDHFWFASTGQVIARRLGLPPNLEYVTRGLRYWIYEDDSEISPYAGLKSLMPGSFVEVALSGDGRCVRAQSERYYDLDARVRALQDELAGAPFDRLADLVQQRLSSSVELRLRADVPVGVSLSGGLDSSSVAALLSEGNAKVIGFTYGSPDDRKSEGPLVRELQEKLDIKVEFIDPKPEELKPAFWSCLDAQDAPFPGTSIAAQFMVFKTARAQGIKVLLGGQGGDEAFMGYRKFHLFRLAELARKRDPMGWAASALGILRMTAAKFPGMPVINARHRYSKSQGMDVGIRLPDIPTYEFGYRAANDLWQRQLLDVTRCSLPTLLRYEDRNSMGNSIESRLPFLDYRVVELGLALPTALKLRNGYGKWIVRQAMKGRIPESIRSARYKRGFDVDERKWIASGLGESIRQALHERHSLIRDILPCDVDIDTTYSDDRLRANGPGFAEATSLIWLGTRL